MITRMGARYWSQPKLLTMVKKDIGTYADKIGHEKSVVGSLQTDHSRVMESIYEEVGSQQVSRPKFPFPPPPIIDKAFSKL